MNYRFNNNNNPWSISILCKTREQCSKSETKPQTAPTCLGVRTSQTYLSSSQISSGSTVLRLTWQCVKILHICCYGNICREIYKFLMYFVIEFLCHTIILCPCHPYICRQLFGHACMHTLHLSVDNCRTYLSVSATSVFWLNPYCWARLPSSEAGRTNII